MARKVFAGGERYAASLIKPHPPAPCDLSVPSSYPPAKESQSSMAASMDLPDDLDDNTAHTVGQSWLPHQNRYRSGVDADAAGIGRRRTNVLLLTSGPALDCNFKVHRAYAASATACGDISGQQLLRFPSQGVCHRQRLRLRMTAAQVSRAASQPPDFKPELDR